jgi:hypothetical protein
MAFKGHESVKQFLVANKMNTGYYAHESPQCLAYLALHDPTSPWKKTVNINLL